jgi:hypothetical protein
MRVNYMPLSVTAQRRRTYRIDKKTAPAATPLITA